MTSTTAPAENQRDEFSQSVNDLRDFLKAKPEATFKQVFERYLVHMFTSLRSENAETRADIEDLYERFMPPELEMLNDMEAFIVATGLFIDQLMQSAGIVKEGDKTLPKDWPLAPQFVELSKMMADMKAQIDDARAEYEDDDDDDDPSGEGEPEDDDSDEGEPEKKVA